MERKQSTSRTKRLCSSFGLLVRQFLLILGKNFLLQFRRPIGTIAELVVPIFAVGVIMAARLILLSFESTAPTDECFITFPTDVVRPLNIIQEDYAFIYYAPNTPEVEPLAEILNSTLSILNVELVGVADQDEFVTRIRSENTSTRWCHAGLSPGIFFENVNSTDIRYTIRMRPDTEWYTELTGFSQVGPRTDPNTYFQEGFVHLEKIIDESIFQWKTGNPSGFDVTMRQLPYPKYIRDSFLENIELFLSLFFVVSFIYTAGVIVKELVIEKESRIRETMKMMGLSNWILTSTWYLKQLMFLFIPGLIITLFLKYGQLFPFSDGFLILVFIMFYFSAGIAFCFFISVWFTSTRIGLMAGMLGWFVFYFPYFFLSPNYNTLNLGTKVGTCLLPNTCAAFGIKVLNVLEIRREGLLFSNLAKPLSQDDTFHMGWVIFMFFIDTIFYMTLYWYIDAVKPGKYGSAKPFYFLFMPSYWCGKSLTKVKAEEVSDYINPYTDQNAHEKEPTDLDIGISIKGLSKIYNRRNPRRRKVAVDSINLNMYQGQITALLGHNGAGKTTTMSMLTGLYTPTLGTALVDGYDINTDMDLIRRNLGICPQHNVLFDRLTVSEHLIFFSLLKGSDARSVRADANSMIDDLQLVEKKKVQSQNLSGGMKRKLSVGIALIGGSKFVVLDEPTSGMDPYARRGTWDLLIKHKQGRTILLTTHFMDEADLLGDRIAIMAEGKIKCSGTSLFLKSRYGVGYHLNIVKEADCDSLEVTGLVTQHVSNAEKVTDVGAELSFILPSSSVGQFPALFDLLDKNKVQLGVSSFGVSVTTMEEVFIKVGQQDDETLLSKLEKQDALETHIGLEDQSNSSKEQFEIQMPDTAKSDKINTGIILWLQQFYGLFLKRVYNFIRFWMNIIWQLVIPMIFVLLSLVFAVTVGQQTFGTEPSRDITVSSSSLSDNRTFFWAVFGDLPQNVLNFNMSDTDAVGINNYVQYTHDILQTKRERTMNSTNITECCRYEYQILDNYCARQDSGNFRECMKNSFGYSQCRSCLQCTFNSLGTCTPPPNFDYFANADGFCPTPPRINEDFFSNGSLDDYNTYVAERLLVLSGDVLNTNDFFARIQGGFVVSSSGSVVSSELSPGSDQCGMDNELVGINTTTQDFIDLTIWYNNQPFHMAAASINAFYSLLLRNATGMDYTITVTNNPLPNDDKTQIENAANDPTGFAISSIATFGLSFLFASFILFPVEERNSKAKHIQFVSGAQASTYWMSAYAFDMVNAFVPCVITFILFACFNVDGYNGVENLFAILLLLIFTSWAAIPITYIFSFVFSNPLVGFAIMVLFHYFGALIFQICVLMVRIFSSQSNGDKLHYVALLHPIYALGSGFSGMYSNYVLKDSCAGRETQCNEQGVEYVDSIFEFKAPGIGHIFLYLFFEGILFILLTVLIERQFFVPELRTFLNNLSSSKVTAEIIDQTIIDNDVLAERERVKHIDSATASQQAVVINNLSKVYYTMQTCTLLPKQAVNGINLIIPKGECFGLLGVNGAGKTTTFKMLTGDISPSGGTASISGYDIKTQLRQVQQRVGYCPQFDAIIDRLTGRELLTLFARLRGVPEAQINSVVTNEVTRLDLTKHAKKRCGTYSGGNKRKLSTAIALVGNPPIVLLDEPTTGMDPATRRFLWNALIKVVQGGKSVILTSHSMEECEALCTRLAIMVNGQFKCLGSLQHLKSKFGSGYTLQIRVYHGDDKGAHVTMQKERNWQRSSFKGSFKRQESYNRQPSQSPPPPINNAGSPLPVVEVPSPYDTVNLKAFVAHKFPGALLLEEHQGAVTYQLPGEGVTWSYMFGAIEEKRAELNVVDYSISQTTLDQIFINFAKDQFAED